MMQQLLFTIWLAAAAAAPLGVWRGTSICTGVRPACHDETAVYRITATNDPNIVNVWGGKVVDGKDEAMSDHDLPFTIDYEHRVLTYEFERNNQRGLFTFTWSGSKMTGTLKTLPDGLVVRNITLQKSAR